MKKGKILLGLIMSFIAAQTVVFAAECTKSPISDSSCPSSSTFYDSLRFEHKYGFNDYFYAVGGTNNIVGLSYEIKEQCDYNNSSVETQDGFFYTTNDLRNRKGVLPARTEPYWIITSNDYEVRKLPPKRDKGNLLVKYNVTYNVNGGSNKTHTECMYYEITRCGDGTLDSGYETCDPNDSTQAGWGDGGCSADCKPVKKGACSSTYNGQRVTTLSGGNHLCKEGTYSSFYHDTLNHKWTWKCNNSLGNGEECSATEPYCGDGIKDSGEKCDPGDTVNKTGWGNGGCDKVTCTPINVGDPLCNSQYNGQRLDSLTEGDHLCTEGKYSEFKYHESLHKWTWKCKNSLGNGVDCSAVKPYCGDGVKDPGEECDGSDDCSDTCKIMYCGDGIKNNGEECDPNDSSQAGWGPDGCNQFCEPKFNPDVSCTQTFKKTLRCGESYSFPDSFKAGGTDRWMYSFSVNFQEGSDLNGGSNPTFLWTDVLKNNNMLVKAGQTMKIIDSTPKYQIKNCPSKRSYENLYIEYIVTTAGENPNGQELPNAKLSTHKECVYYDVSRCGDGVLDEDYNEECDPGSAGTSTLPDGRICNSNCKIEDAPSTKGKLKVEKTLISESKYVTEKGQELEWQIKVTAVGGDVKNVLITDKLPEILSYVSYTSELPSGVTMNSGQPTKSNNDKIIKWQTSGTLKEGKSIILKVKTKVEIMPKKTDNYENVACAEADNLDEECKEVPIITPGKLKVEKTLISESKYVTEKGQELEWQIKVTAVDGDVENVLITDKLPEILSYVSYTSELPSGVTMNSGQPTKSNNDKIIKWQTSGTLKEGKSIILKVKTKVEIMPKKTDNYENVACAEADDVDEDCQPVPIGKGTLVPEKTLVGSKEVKKVGDLVLWKLKVTAVGGDVEDPIITDKLPPVLGYSGYMVSNYPSGVTIPDPTFGTEDSLETIEWKTTGTLKENDYIEIQLTTYAKVMPDKEYNNVLCVKTKDTPEDCVPVPIPAPKLRIKKSFSDGTKEKTVKVGDEIEYKVSFGNKGDASATITSVKDFLPKNVEYVSSEIHITGSSNHTNNPSGSDVIYSNKKVDGVYIDIYGGITLEPGTEGYILLKGKILSDNKDNRTNFACIYLNDKKPDDSIIDGDRCDDAVHKFDDGLLCGAPEITTKSFTSAGGSTSVVCKASGGKKANIELDCGSGATLSGSKSSILTGSNISSLTGTCVYPKNTGSSSKSYSVVCKVNGETGDSCKDKVTVDGTGGPSDPKCDKIITNPETLASGKDIEVTCKTSGGSAYILIDCKYKSTNTYDSNNKNFYVSSGKVDTFTGTCKNYQLDTKIQCLVKNKAEDKWEDINDKVESNCGKTKGSTPPSCFPAGTKVAMADGTKKNIEDIEEGDMVLSYNTDTNTNESSMVAKTIVHEDNEHEMYELTINGKVLKATAVHPFYVRKSGFTNKYNRTFGAKNLIASIDYDWVEAQDLKVGDKLLMIDGSLVEIEKINHYPNKETVYNLEVEDNHDYFVDKGYLVHNKSCFLAGTKVIMADGTVKNIEDVKIGEKVLGLNGSINTVLSYDRHLLGERRVWSINGGEYFVSDEHPFMTTEGRKSFVPEKTKEELGWIIPELKVGDILVTSNGLETIERIDSKEMDRDTPIYNFMLDGDHTYHANGYLVHNKDNCFPAGIKVAMADGTVKNIEEVEEGDEVLSYNTTTNTKESSTVAKTIVHEDSEHEMYELTINGKVLKVTAVHPFYVRKSGFTNKYNRTFGAKNLIASIDYDWVEAQDLKVGDKLLMIDGSLVEIEKINHYPNKETVYNLEVEGNHDYFVDEGYLVHNKSCFLAGTKVTMADGTVKNIEDVKIGEKLLGSNGSINTVLSYDRHLLGERRVWSINGGEYFVSDEHPFMTTEGWKSFVPEKTKEELGWIIPELKVGDILVTSNGLETIEKIDSKEMDRDTPIYNFALDGDHTYHANGYLVHNKGGGPTPDPIIYPMVECYDINANQLSYEQGEILPFYWNLDNLSKEDIWYLSGSFNKPVSGKCEEDEEGLIALNSMVCSYAIIDPDLNTKLTGNFPCLTEENFTVEPLYNSRLEVGKNTMCGTSNNKCYFSFTTKATKTKLWSNLNTIPNFGEGRTRFGEYKISMTKISYLQCIDGKWTQKDKTSEKELCSSTFMLTNPYTVQKTPSGNFKASTETLSKYKYCEKYEKVEGTNNLKCIKWNSIDRLLNAITPSEYKQNEAVNKAMEGFINKYSKLAVSAGNGLKKVPGKNIYFVNGPICLGSECNVIKLDKPTTIVQIDGSAEIKGDVNTDNLMLLTKGKIKFSDSNSCTHRQIVKGIFYAEKGIERELVTKNKPDRVKKQGAKRCTEGGLTIKGVLIGDGLEQMMKYSRSNLNGWHKSKTAQTVMNGASVLIEYSPSVFTKGSMPPGAEDFTTALSIYKD